MLWFLFRPSSVAGQAQRITLVLSELLWPAGENIPCPSVHIPAPPAPNPARSILHPALSSVRSSVPALSLLCCQQLVSAALIHLPRENDVIVGGQSSCALLPARLRDRACRAPRREQEQQCLGAPGGTSWLWDRTSCQTSALADSSESSWDGKLAGLSLQGDKSDLVPFIKHLLFFQWHTKQR